MNPLRAYLTPINIALGGIVGVAVLVAIWFVFIEPGRAAQREAEARVAAAAAQSRATSAAEAVNRVAERAEDEALTDQATRENRDAILSSPGARAPVDPGVDDAGRRAICLRQSARCTPGCVRLLGPCS